MGYLYDPLQTKINLHGGFGQSSYLLCGHSMCSACLAIHPRTSHYIVNRILWAFCVYLEAVSVLPQLRTMQNTRVVEPFTAHYVFALGVVRFLSYAHWILQVMDSHGYLLITLGHGLWPSMVLLSEIVQTFILADLCYYYVKSIAGGALFVFGQCNLANSNGGEICLYQALAISFEIDIFLYQARRFSVLMN